MWRQFRTPQCPGSARPHSDLRMTPLRWASQEPTNVATVSLFAAPRDGEASFWSAYDIAPVGLLGTREHCGNFVIRNPQGLRGLTLVSV